MAELKAVFFDVRGTLFDGKACARHVMEIVLSRFPGELPGNIDRVGPHFNAVLLDQISSAHLRRIEPLSRLKRFEALLDLYGIKKPGLAQEINALYDATRRMMLRQFLRPGAFRVLDQLGGRGLLRGAIMNGTVSLQRALLSALNLQDRLDLVVLGDVEGYNKPDTRLFERALEQGGVRADEALYVGDSLVTDVLGASRASIPTVWLSPRPRSVPAGLPAPDFTIGSLRELIPITEF